MLATNTALQPEIDQIVNDQRPRPFFHWKGFFRVRQPYASQIPQDDDPHVPYEERDNIFRPLKILSIDFERDYEKNCADETTLVCLFGSGQWLKVLQPFRNNLEFVLTREQRSEEDLGSDPDEQEATEVFLAIPKVDPETVAQGQQVDRIPRAELDLMGTVQIEFQLTDLSIEKIRSVSVGGIYRRCKPEDVIKAVLSKETQDLVVDGQEPAIQTLKISPADNQEEREHILIPQGTSVLDVPGYIHRHCGGVYSHGINHYIQNKNWYVYPLFNVERRDQEDKTLTVLKLPHNHYDDVERTYRTDGDKLIILATSQSQFNDHGDELYRTEGNGIRFADARQYLSGQLVETQDNKAISHRQKLNNEFLTQSVSHGDTPQNHVVLSADNIHANPFYENSKLSQRQGNIYSFVWKNADAALLYPGMPVKIQYLQGDEVKELVGSLLKVHQSIQLLGKGLSSIHYRQVCGLFVYAIKAKDD